MTETTQAAGQERILNALADPPDIRDRMYEPSLGALAPTLEPSPARRVLDQGREGACTGFALAAVINQLRARQRPEAEPVSARMLYEMARRHDEWPGEAYEGSSCRGAIRGWKNMGVCRSELWPEKGASEPRRLTVARAIDARTVTLGAYYRLRTEIADYHAALNDVGAVYASARVHAGWRAPRGEPARITPSRRTIGGHAFAIVGYDGDGFWVQNSWGIDWGDEGLALWSYEDWLENVTDGWVVQLALPTPQIFGLQAGARRGPGGELPGADERERLFRRPPPKRLEIAGHFVHFDDGSFKARGDYWSTLDDVRQSADRLAASDGYDHLLVYAHGGLNSPKASARRVRSLRAGFRRNRIYPFHIMYDTGLAEEIQDVVRRGLRSAEGRAGAWSDWTDNLVEAAVRKPGTALWEEMKRDARTPFAGARDGVRTIEAFAERLAGTRKRIHLAGHSTGGVLLGHLLECLERRRLEVRVSSLTLFAPACRVSFFHSHYRPFLDGSSEHVRVDRMVVYNLTDALERDDQVAGAYRKSLLYLVSRAFEREEDTALLGMERHADPRAEALANVGFVLSNGRTGRRTRARTHGGFDKRGDDERPARDGARQGAGVGEALPRRGDARVLARISHRARALACPLNPRGIRRAWKYDLHIRRSPNPA